MTQQTKTKPRCVKGTACGYSCISGKKQCSERIKARDAAELLKSTGAKDGFDLASLKINKSLSPIVIGGIVSGEHKITVKLYGGEAVGSKTAVEVNSYNVSVTVNGEYNSKEAEVPPEDASRVALAAARATLDAISKLPDGTLLRNSPYKNDSSFEARKRMYQKMGFGLYDEDSGEQYGVTYKGKIRPVTRQEFLDKIS